METKPFGQKFFEKIDLYGAHRASVIELSRKNTEILKLSYAQILAEADKLAQVMLSANWNGHRIILCLPTCMDYIIAIASCAKAGVTAVPTSLARTKPQAKRLLKIIEDAQAEVILVGSTQGLPFHKKDSLCKVVTMQQLRQSDITTLGTSPHSNNDIVFIQYTSGSTSVPKGVQISANSLLANIDLMYDHFSLDQYTVVFSWLPMFHDMGLVGVVYQCLRRGIPLVFTDPFTFIQKPLRWLEGIQNYNATCSVGPNFAFKAVIDRVNDKDIEVLDLSCLKTLINGSEPISPRITQTFFEKLSPHGLKREAILPCYGLAESTLFVTGAKVNEGYHVREIAGTLPGTVREVVSSGYINGEMDVRIIGECRKQELPPGIAGEIVISGASLFSGYVGKEDSSDYFVWLDGKRFFRTGDVGFINGRELYVMGRIKDVIIIRGRNIYPSDIEDVVASLLVNDKLNSVLCYSRANSDGEEEVVVAIEIPRDNVDETFLESLPAQVRQIVDETLNVFVSHIRLVQSNSLLKTSSGKLQRSACKLLFESTTEFDHNYPSEVSC